MKDFYIDTQIMSYVISRLEEGFETAPLCVSHDKNTTVNFCRESNEQLKKLKVHGQVEWNAIPTLVDNRPQQAPIDFEKKYNDLLSGVQVIENMLIGTPKDLILKRVRQLLADQR